MGEPTAADLKDPRFEAVWQAIKRWDLCRDYPEIGRPMYSGATGTDVMTILEALGSVESLSPSEALFAFAGWITTRPEAVTASAKHDAAPWAELVRDFCNHYRLPAPREGWENRITPLEPVG